MWPEIISIGSALLGLGLHLYNRRTPQYHMPKGKAEQGIKVSPGGFVGPPTDEESMFVPTMQMVRTGLFSSVDVVVGYETKGRAD